MVKSVWVFRSSGKLPDDKSAFKEDIIILKIVEGRGVGDTQITDRHFGGDTHITSDMCAGIHISRGYTYHCDTATSVTSDNTMTWSEVSSRCQHERFLP